MSAWAYESYISLRSIVTICRYVAPFLRYSETLVENRRFEHTPPLFGAHTLGVTPLVFYAKNIGEIPESYGYCTVLFA